VNKFDRSGAIRLDIPENALCGLTRLKGVEFLGRGLDPCVAPSEPHHRLWLHSPLEGLCSFSLGEEQCSRIIVRAEKKRAKWNGRSCALSRS
jgi:hypothetical protein